jgi:hypothetical protein
MRNRQDLALALRDSRRRLMPGVLVVALAAVCGVAVVKAFSVPSWVVWVLVALAAFRPVGDLINVLVVMRRLSQDQGLKDPRLTSLTLAQQKQVNQGRDEAHMSDAILGNLSFDFEAQLWFGVIASRESSVRLSLAGNGSPNRSILENARIIATEFPKFGEQVKNFLSTEANRQRWNQYASEIVRLTVDEISFCWTERPTDAIVFLGGSSDLRQWRCDYVRGTLRDLAFDD